MKSVDVMALAAHPDDVELTCGGTMIRLREMGKTTGIVDLTRGEMGTRGTPEQRMVEAKNAAEILGLSFRENLGLPDAHLGSTPEMREPVIRMVRRYRPHICLISAPHDRHPDHPNSAKLLTEALFFSGLRKIETYDEDGRKQKPWRPAHILHYMQDRPFKPDFVFDITDTMKTREKAILAYETQFKAQADENGPETYISTDDFFEQIRARARHYGHLVGATFGEPFKYYNGPVPLQSFDAFFESSPKR